MFFQLCEREQASFYDAAGIRGGFPISADRFISALFSSNRLLMKLRYDPFQIFRLSKTPAGLYARQKWLQEYGTPHWQRDFQETVSFLWADQLPDGSWHHTAMATIVHLFGLHLKEFSRFLIVKGY